MLKKIVIAFFATLILTNNAQANIFENVAPKGSNVSFYAGGDTGISLFNGTSIPFSVHAGVDMIRKNEIDFGAEAYAQIYTSSSQLVIGFDALVYPIATSDIHWFGGAGLSYHRYGSHASEFGLNVLGGARYSLSNKISLRARAKYFLAPNNLDLTIGADYHF